MNRIKSGKSKENKEGKKCVQNSADLGAALTGVQPRKAAAKNYVTPRSNLGFKLSTNLHNFLRDLHQY